MPRRLLSILFAAALLAACVGPANDCMVVAVAAQAKLPPSVWSRRLVVAYPDTSIRHVYLIFETPEGTLKAYDRAGTRAIQPVSRAPFDLMRAVDPAAVFARYDDDPRR